VLRHPENNSHKEGDCTPDHPATDFIPKRSGCRKTGWIRHENPGGKIRLSRPSGHPVWLFIYGGMGSASKTSRQLRRLRLRLLTGISLSSMRSGKWNVSLTCSNRPPSLPLIHPICVVGTITFGGDHFIMQIKNRGDIEIHEVTEENRDSLPDLILERVEILFRQYLQKKNSIPFS